MKRPILSAFAVGLALAPLLAGAQAQNPTSSAADTPRPAPTPPAPDARPVVNLSLQEAVRLAMANSVDIAIDKFNPLVSDEDVSELKGFYQPTLTASVLQDSRQIPARSFFQQQPFEDRDTLFYNLGLEHPLTSGGNLRLSFRNDRTTTNNVFDLYSPGYGSALDLSLSQPLLRDLKTDARRYQIRVAKKNREISDVQFHQTVVNTVAQVKDLYYDLLYAIDSLEAQRESLDLAVKLVVDNRNKVRVGTMAQIDVVSAESEQAAREELVIRGEAEIGNAEDALRRVIYADNGAATWASRIVPTDRPTADPLALNTAAAITKALANRTDIAAVRKRLENSEYAIDYTHNQRLPALDLVGSYGTSGVGGTFLVRDNSQGIGGPVVDEVSGNYGDAVSDVFKNEFPTWTVGLNFSVPLFNRQANAANARARLSRDQSLVALRRLEMQITAEVRAAARAVEANYKRVETTQATRLLETRRLDIENKKFDAGRSTNFLITQSQRDLSDANLNQLKAIADYRKSLVAWERVQEAGFELAGGSGTVSIR
jgi:outer membrane protein TolC